MEGKKLISVFLILTAALAAIFLPGFSELQKLREKNENILKRIDILEGNNRELEEEVRQLKENPAYVEGKAREKLGIIRKDEYIYRGKGAD